MHALHALAGLDALGPDVLLAALSDPDSRVREHAVTLGWLAGCLLQLPYVLQGLGARGRQTATLLPPRRLVADLLEDDAAVAAHMLAVLHASASAGASRAELGAALDVGPERIEAGWAYLPLRAPAGLRVQRDA